MHFLTRLKGDRVSRDQAIGHVCGGRRACVTVKVEYRDRRPVLVVQADSGVGVLKLDAMVAELPEEVLVLDEDGTKIKASGRFYVTTETFDPFHALTDVFDVQR